MIVKIIAFTIFVIWAWYWYGKVNGDVKIFHERISDLREEFEGKYNTIHNLLVNQRNEKIIKVVKGADDVIIPTRGSEYSAGYDLYAYTDKEKVTIMPHETVKIGTGLSMAIPEDQFGAIFARSGLSTKQGLAPANKVGVIDCDYRGEIIVELHNDTNEEKVVQKGDRIAQMILLPYQDIIFHEVDKLDDSERGMDGFGSTGK